MGDIRPLPSNQGQGKELSQAHSEGWRKVKQGFHAAVQALKVSPAVDFIPKKTIKNFHIVNFQSFPETLSLTCTWHFRACNSGYTLFMIHKLLR